MVSIDTKRNINKYGTIANDIDTIIHPHGIVNVSLHKYQLQSIHAMTDIENKKLFINKSNTIMSEIGVLANKVGSGKSLCVLGLIAYNDRMLLHSKIRNVCDNVYVSYNRSDVNVYGKNLIVVPNHIAKPVWETYITQYTTFKHIRIRKGMFPINWESLQEYDIVLCTATHYNMLMKSCPWYWNRVIYDEADSINISACVNPKTCFSWFVTSSLNNLLFCNGYYWKFENSRVTKFVTTGIPRNGYIKNIFKSVDCIKEESILSSLIVKMNDEYINECIKLPTIEKNVIICQTPYYLKVIHDIIPPNVIEMLHGHDEISALEMLGCPIDSKENIISFVSRKLHIQKKNYLSKLKYLSSLEIDTNENERQKNQKLIKVSDLITNIDRQISKIKKTVKTIDHEDITHHCPICQCVAENAVVLTCCLNIFCSSCILSLIKYNEGKAATNCPLCRNILGVHEIVKPTSIYMPNKTDVLCNLIDKKRKTVKMVVYYKTDACIDQLIEKIQCNYKILNGNNHTISKTLEWFEQQDNNLLFVNVELYACGINLLMATDLVFFQKMPLELENQLIGRAYRIGREWNNHLKIHLLLHQEES